MPAAKTQFTIQINLHSEDSLQQIAQAYCMTQQKKQSFFEGNWLGEDRPTDIKQYWDSLTDTERAIQKLESTDAAVYMQFHDRLMNSIPKPPVAP